MRPFSRIGFYIAASCLAWISPAHAQPSDDGARLVAAKLVALLEGIQTDQVTTSLSSVDGQWAAVVTDSVKSQCTFMLTQNPRQNVEGWEIKTYECKPK